MKKFWTYIKHQKHLSSFSRAFYYSSSTSTMATECDRYVTNRQRNTSSVIDMLQPLFPDCHLVMGDFIHHDQACISASIFEAVPF
jgi:hypothetical protein